MGASGRTAAGPGRRRVALLILASSSLTTAIASLQALVLVPLYLDAIGARMYGAWAATGDVLLWMNSL